LFSGTVSGDPGKDVADFRFRQQWWRADLQAAVILPRQRFDFDGEPHRLREGGSDGDHTVMRQQTG